MKNKTSYFPEVIGQTSAKKKLSFLLDNYNRSNHVPNILFNAPKGSGKTLLAHKMGKNLKKNFVEINCASVKNLKQFCETFLLPTVVDKDVTIHMDEASELPKDVEMALLTILNPNDTHKTTFSYEEFQFDFDFRRQSWLFSTTEAHQIFPALKDRLKRIDLQAYSQQDLQGILALQLNKAKVKFDNKVLPDIASVLRGNARQAVSMSNDIASFMFEKDQKFTLDHWKEMRDALDILPLGISPGELRLLRLIASRSGSTVTQLSSETGMTRASLQRDGELFLMQHGLMDVRAQSLRHATAKGLRLLEEVGD
ncbi:MAG: AAA family ATPase [Bacteroidetes bacterium]|jgi:Holliday junction resolvasome RuvABC ATP-dependent DNA helicase subunit|nr:MAG: AAA family ATPase [Bacteroidota bacterium]